MRLGLRVVVEAPVVAAQLPRQFTTEEDLRRVILPPRVEIVADLLPVGAVVCSAEPGLGKSFLFMTVEHYIAFGTPMGNWPLQESRRCLVVDFESDDYLIKDRSFSVTPSLPSDTAPVVPVDAPSVKYLRDEQGYYGISGSTVDARFAVLEQELREAVELGDPYSYVRIDTLKMFIGSAPRAFAGNIYDWENLWCTRLNRLAQTYGIAIVLLHHTNKAGESSGSTGIAGGVTSLLKMSRNEENKHELILESLKTRASSPFRSVLIQDSEGVPKFTDALTVTQAELVGLARRIADLLAQRGPQTRREIMRAFGHNTRSETIKSAINRMSSKRRIESHLGRWQLVAAPEHDPQPQLFPSGPRTCLTCSEHIIPLVDPLQVYHGGCEPAAGPGPDVAAGSPPPEEVDPEVVEPGKWSAFAALKDSIAGSKLHPVRFIAAPARDHGAWPIFAADDNTVGERMTGEPSWFNRVRVPDAFTSVAILDRNGSYPSACSSVTLAAGVLAHTGPDADVRAGGIFLIKALEWTDPRIGHPLGTIADVPGPWWISAPHMALLQKLVKSAAIRPVEVLDSWTGRPVGNLLTDFGRAVKAERARAREEGPAPLAEVKRASSVALRSLWCSTRSPFWRPDWSVSVRAEAAVRHWAVAYRAVLAGEVCLGLANVDEVAFLIPQGVPADASWAPAGYTLSAEFGGVKHKHDVRISKGITVASPITLEQFRIRANL